MAGALLQLPASCITCTALQPLRSRPQHPHQATRSQRLQPAAARCQCSPPGTHSRAVRPACQPAPSTPCCSDSQPAAPLGLTRRQALWLPAAAAGLAALQQAQPARAVQGLTAGRIPGLSPTTNSEGYYTYTRPEGKSGGHGVGWSEIPRYYFQIPPGWQETPVSIADLGGTEIDLRYGSPEQGGLEVVVAPIARFADIPFNADLRIGQLGPPDRIIAGFAPELYGNPLTDEDVLNTQVEEADGLTYYRWELKPHNLVAATALGNRLFIIALRANGRQWRKAEAQLRHIQQSFRVPLPKSA